MESLQDEIQEANANREGKDKAPLTEINLDKEQMNLEIASRYQEVGPTTSQSSKASTFKELPSFLGDYKSRDEVRKVPIQDKLATKVLDTSNLQALLSTLVRVLLTLVIGRHTESQTGTLA